MVNALFYFTAYIVWVGISVYHLVLEIISMFGVINKFVKSHKQENKTHVSLVEN